MNHNDSILRKIELACHDVIKDIIRQTPPKFSFPNRVNWDGLVFDEAIKVVVQKANQAHSVVDSHHLKSRKKFAMMLKVFKIVYTLIQENRYCTKRDIFYQYPDYYTSQHSMDRIIDDVASMLKVPRWDLHILASSKGLVAGDLCFQDETGIYIDCKITSSGVPVAAHMKDMQNLQTNAKFILVVEKDATFQHLLEHQFCQKMNPCIMITGKGFPDNGTRLLLKQLWLQYQLPIFILVDADPHGMEIMFIYKYGSKSQAFENQYLAIPQAEWIGIWPEDIERLNIKACLAKMTDNDLKKALSLKNRLYTRNDESILAQIDIMIKTKQKAEIQCLDSISNNHLSDVYLPSKINLLYSSMQRDLNKSLQ